jgi:hypothetical protein
MSPEKINHFTAQRLFQPSGLRSLKRQDNVVIDYIG